MPEQFTVFNSSNRNANVQYNSDVYTVPVDTTDTMVEIAITVMDLVNEPGTTIFYWSIERSTDGNVWYHKVGGSTRGRDGVIPPTPPGASVPRSVGAIATSIDNIRGQQIRGSLYFTSANDQRKRFGVQGKTW